MIKPWPRGEIERNDCHRLLDRLQLRVLDSNCHELLAVLRRRVLNPSLTVEELAQLARQLREMEEIQ